MGMGGCVRSVIKSGQSLYTGELHKPDGRIKLTRSRYILQMNVMDYAGSFWITAFNEVAEQIIGVSANELMKFKVSCESWRSAEIS